MKKVMNRIWMLAMLTIVSVTATAQDAKVKVDLNESYTGGTITVSEDQKAVEGGTEITITVTPKDGYYIRKSDIIVVTTITPGGTRDGAPGFGDALNLSGDEPEFLTMERKYAFIVPTGLGAWVKEANFHSAANIGAEGSDVTWSYSQDAKGSEPLVISGKGATCDFNGEGFVDPWAAFRSEITSVVIEKEVTGLGADIFKGCTSLTSIKIENYNQVLGLGVNAIPEGVAIDVPGNLFNEYKITDGWSAFAKTIDSKDGVKMAGVEFGDHNKYDTFCSDQDVMVPSVLHAYVVTKITEKGLEITEVKSIPKGAPVLLFSKELKDNDFRTAAADAEEVKTNLLGVAPEGGQEVKLGEVYLLYNDVFYFTQAGTIPAGGVFLTIPKDEAPAKTRSSYPLGGADGTTGIRYLPLNGLSSQSVWYGLDGRQYDTMPTQKGIYIVNGRKVVIK